LLKNVSWKWSFLILKVAIWPNLFGFLTNLLVYFEIKVAIWPKKVAIWPNLSRKVASKNNEF
jgi:hypothetical protein